MLVKWVSVHKKALTYTLGAKISVFNPSPGLRLGYFDRKVNTMATGALGLSVASTSAALVLTRYRINVFLSCKRNAYNYLYHLSASKCQKMNICFHFSSNNHRRKLSWSVQTILPSYALCRTSSFYTVSQSPRTVLLTGICLSFWARRFGLCRGIVTGLPPPPPPPPRIKWPPFSDDIFRCIFANEHFCIFIKILLKFVPKRPIDNSPSLVKIMAWRQYATSHYLNQCWPDSLTHICGTRRMGWVKPANHKKGDASQLEAMSHTSLTVLMPPG